MRLIDTDKLLEKTECLFKDLNSTEDYMGIGYNHGVGDSIAIIKNAPTIEAEPVVHCIDCITDEVAQKIIEEANKACTNCQEWVCDECEYRHWRNRG